MMRSSPTNDALPSAVYDISHSVVDVPSTAPEYDFATVARVSLPAPGSSSNSVSSHDSIVNFASTVSGTATSSTSSNVSFRKRFPHRV